MFAKHSFFYKKNFLIVSTKHSVFTKSSISYCTFYTPPPHFFKKHSIKKLNQTYPMTSYLLLLHELITFSPLFIIIHIKVVFTTFSPLFIIRVVLTTFSPLFTISHVRLWQKSWHKNCVHKFSQYCPLPPNTLLQSSVSNEALV